MQNKLARMLGTIRDTVKVPPLLKTIRIAGCRDRIVTRTAPNKFMYTWHVDLPKCRSYIELEETYRWVEGKRDGKPPSQVLDGDPVLTIGQGKTIIVVPNLTSLHNFPETQELIEYFLGNTDKLVRASNLLDAIETGIQALYRAETSRHIEFTARVRSKYGYGASD